MTPSPDPPAIIWQRVAHQGVALSPAEVDWAGATNLVEPTADLVAPLPDHQPGSMPADIAAGGGEDEWWWRTRTSAESLRIKRISFPAEVFVDGVKVAEAASEFLSLEVALPSIDCEVAIACRSLAGWLLTRRPRGRWRSALTGAQGLRWARVSLVGRVPAFPGQAAIGARGVRLGAPAPLSDLRVGVEMNDGLGVVTVSARSRFGGEHLISLTGPEPSDEPEFVQRVTVTAGARLVARFEVPQPRLWWPAGHGGQPCYRVGIAVAGAQVAQRTIGFRTLRAERRDGGFSLLVNDIAVFCRGAVLIGPAPQGSIIDTLADAGATMVRFAGGTVPATTQLMEDCARRGVLVWQDSMLATFDHPAELDAIVAAELREWLGENGGNPALAVICGGSETEQQPEMMGLPVERRGQPLIEQQLPAALTEWAEPVGGAPCYVVASPTSGRHGSAIRPDDGVAHWFGVGGYRQPLSAVDSAGVRFATESLAFANPPDEIEVGSEAVRDRTSAWLAGIPADRGADWDFEQVRDHYVGDIFGVDTEVERRGDPERYLDLGRAAVVAAMGRCHRRWRRRDDPCAGALVLSAHDLRPGAGWGLLDHRGRPKAVLRALRRAWAPVTVLIDDAGLAGIRIDAHNDTAVEIEARLELRATNGFGHLTVEGDLAIRLPAHGSVTVHDAELTGRFSDLGHTYRFGSPVADALEVRLIDAAGDLVARDALIVNPSNTRSAAAGVEAVLDPEAGLLTVTSHRALRAVILALPGFEAVDDCFELPGALPYRVRVRRLPEVQQSAGWCGEIRSVDLDAPVPIRVVESAR